MATMLLCGLDSDAVWGQCCGVVWTVMLCGDNAAVWFGQRYCVGTMLLCGEDSDAVW